MKNSQLIIRCMPKIRIGGGSVDLDLHVLTLKAVPVSHYELMCEAIDADIQNPEGSGADVLENIRRIEEGETEFISGSGNAWIINITSQAVWFEGLYSQGEGGAVTLAQFKLAVQTYIQFLADPQSRPIEVAFPDDLAPEIPDVSAIVERYKREEMEQIRVRRLNTREMELLHAIEQGGSDLDIAQSLRMSVERLTQYRQEVLKKTQTASLPELFELIRRIGS